MNIHTIATAEPNALDHLLETLAKCLTPASARRIAAFRADAATQTRIAELAEKCNEGELSPSERREYEAYVQAIDFISILQAKSRRLLAKHRKAK
jgi:hypothetical protein